MESKALVSADWLLSQLDNTEVVILDATLAKPTSSGNIPNQRIQIPGAQFFDIDHAFSDKSSSLPHMMCDAERFEKEAQRLGIRETSHVVIYDTHGIYSAPRAWWMLKSMGHQRVSVLNGGLPEWLALDYPVEEKINKPHLTGDFSASYDKSCFVDAKYVLEHASNEDIAILDARSCGRFNGTEPEPRAGLRGGHIPSSINLPFTEVVDDFRMKDKQILKQILEPLQLDKKRLVFSCGSGLTACIILLASYIAGYRNLSVYDGSWSEWGMPGRLPVAT